MKTMIVILLTAAITNNYVLVKFLGICSFLGVSRKLDQAVGMSAAVIFVMLMSTAVTWPIYHFLLDGGVNFVYMETVVFILVIAALVQLVEIILKKYLPALHASLGVYLPLITTNCAVLGVALINVQRNYSILEGVVYGFATAAGFFIAIVLMAGIREKIEDNDIPESFKGTPIVLLTACLMAIAFFGFSGLK